MQAGAQLVSQPPTPTVGPFAGDAVQPSMRGRMTGWEVATQARLIDAEFPVVYMTGAAADDWGAHGVPNSILLQKPFAPAQLVTAVSQLLNRGQQPPT